MLYRIRCTAILGNTYSRYLLLSSETTIVATTCGSVYGTINLPRSGLAMKV
jgi:hypothetical protein